MKNIITVLLTALILVSGQKAFATQEDKKILSIDGLYELFYLKGDKETEKPGSIIVSVRGVYLDNLGKENFDDGASGGLRITGYHPISQLNEEPRPGANEVICEYHKKFVRKAMLLQTNKELIIRGTLRFKDNISSEAGAPVVLEDCEF